ncbi:UNVERIFIED_CONTAM: Serine/threonine-protein kinase ulk3 [Siphonaria sp. JEL0065]|nr:Serine/threonine-protein kinase ulk3 [Siphonaria sp. JEL0065]
MGDPSLKTLPVLKIGDFGLADFESESFNERIGTLQYMAPEVLSHSSYDARCDLWSMGIVFYEFLVGNSPFITAKTTDQLLSLIISPIPACISLPQPISSTTSNEACVLISHLLTRNPHARIRFEALWGSEYIDLAHIPTAESLRKAHGFLNQAITLDEALGPPTNHINTMHMKSRLESLDNVVHLYLESLEHLFAHLQFTLNRESVEAQKANAQVSMCLERAEVRKTEARSIRESLKKSFWRQDVLQSLVGFVGKTEAGGLDSGLKFKLPFEKSSPYRGYPTSWMPGEGVRQSRLIFK